jgi:hypothetical protein
VHSSYLKAFFYQNNFIFTYLNDWYIMFFIFGILFNAKYLDVRRTGPALRALPYGPCQTGPTIRAPSYGPKFSDVRAKFQ